MLGYDNHTDLQAVGIQIQEMPVSSAIMSPWHKEVVVHNGHIEVTGKTQCAFFLCDLIGC